MNNIILTDGCKIYYHEIGNGYGDLLGEGEGHGINDAGSLAGKRFGGGQYSTSGSEQGTGNILPSSIYDINTSL